MRETVVSNTNSHSTILVFNLRGYNQQQKSKQSHHHRLQLKLMKNFI